MEFLRTALPFWALFLLTWVCVVLQNGGNAANLLI